MNITKEDKGDLTSLLKLQLTPEDYQEQVDSALKKYRKEMKMPGFRPGNVPVGLVKKMYGKHALVEEINKMVGSKLYEYIQENKIKLIGEPLPAEDEQKDIDWDKDTEFEFVYEMAEAPELSIKLTKKNKGEYNKIIIDDKMVDEQIEQLARQFGSNTTADEIEENDLVRGVLVELDEKGEIAEGGLMKENASMLVSTIKDESKKATFVGQKKGELIAFKPIDVFENEADVAAMLGVTKEEQDKINAQYQLSVNEINRHQAAEINQEFFDKVYGEGVISSEEEMRERIKADAETRFGMNSDYKFFIDFKDKLLKNNKIELPEAFLKRWLIAINKDNDKITPEQIDQEFDAFLEEMRWNQIKTLLVEQAEIKIETEDMIAAAKEFTKAQFMQFGMFNPSDEDVEKWTQEILKDREQSQRIYETELDKKLIAYFKETIKIEEKEISLEDFNKLFEN